MTCFYHSSQEGASYIAASGRQIRLNGRTSSRKCSFPASFVCLSATTLVQSTSDLQGTGNGTLYIKPVQWLTISIKENTRHAYRDFGKSTLG